MKTLFRKTRIPGLVIVKPEIFKDDRGVCSESYKASEFRRVGIRDVFVQENRSVSRKGVLRGFRYQLPPHSQSRLVRCGRGSILEVVVDLRPYSNSYGRSYSIVLSEKNGLMLYMPPGFAHAFLATTDTAEVIYKTSKEYSSKYERGFRWNSKSISVRWPTSRPKVSAKDAGLPDIEF